MTQQVSSNKMVSIAYTIRDRSGNIIEYSGVPVSYVHGKDNIPIFPEVASALEGLSAGESAEVFLTSDQAFGAHDPNLTFSDLLHNAPEEFRFVGAELDAESEDGESMHFRVTCIKDGEITLDGNHPLAGQDITFIVKVMEVRDATLEELAAQTGQQIH